VKFGPVTDRLEDKGSTRMLTAFGISGRPLTATPLPSLTSFSDLGVSGMRSPGSSFGMLGRALRHFEFSTFGIGGSIALASFFWRSTFGCEESTIIRAVLRAWSTGQLGPFSRGYGNGRIRSVGMRDVLR
jgi:hypothetical protein